ncbi:MAG: glucuronate isomerase [Gemmatimonadaceae bacterium]
MMSEGLTRGRATSAPAKAYAPLVLREDRFFDPEPNVRRIAMTLYEATRDLAIISPHGHVDPRILADNSPFPEPTSLIVTPDHYIFRMLYSRGIPLEALGIARRDGTPVESDARKVWQVFADNYYLFRGTPTGAWLDHELYHVFGLRTKLTGESAAYVYDAILERLRTPEYKPRALFDQFNIEVLATTDRATDPLTHHQTIRDSGWGGNVIPCFRPDAAFRIAASEWRDEIAALSHLSGREIGNYGQFLTALAERRLFFKSLGATATDHAVREPYTEALPPDEADRLFQRGLRGEATAADQRRFEGNLLMEMARLSIDDGLVMQIHPGAFSNHNEPVHRHFGADKGGDIPLATEFTRNLQALLNTYGNEPGLTVILFTLDESTYARELSPIAGHYPAVRLGPPWWFHDSMDGMLRYRQRTTETAGIYNTAGFNDDTRAFCSIPARHDLARRMDANYLAALVARHVIDIEEARSMARALAYDLARETYKVGTGPERPSEAAATRNVARVT